MRVAAVALLVCIAAAPELSAAEPPPGAEPFLRSIYSQYLGKTSKGVKLDSRAELRRWFTPALAASMARDSERAARRHEVGTLDGDPFVDAQDWELSDLQITVEAAPAGALGKVSFTNAGTKVALTIDLVKVNAAWRIADIHWPEGSLAALLTPPAAQPATKRVK